MFTYRDSYSNGYSNYIGLISEDGFKNTGLNNGDLKCWFKGHDDDELIGSGFYNLDWTPDFEGDDG